MGKSCLHLRLLLWKNFVLKRDEKVATFFEVLLPIAFSCLLLLGRNNTDIEYFGSVEEYRPFSLPSPYTLNQFRRGCYVDVNDDESSYANSSTTTFPTNSLAYRIPFEIMYTPQNAATSDLMEKVLFNMGLDLQPEKNVKVVGFESEEDLIQYYRVVKKKEEKHCLFAALIFDESKFVGNTFPKDVRYVIRQNNEYKTRSMLPAFSLPGPREKSKEDGGTPDYRQNGFLYLQSAVDLALIQVLTGRELFEAGALFAAMDPKYGNYGEKTSFPVPSRMNDTMMGYIAPPQMRFRLQDFDMPSLAELLSKTMVEYRLQRFSYPPYVSDPYLQVLQNNLPLLIMLSFVVTAPYIVKKVILEKERGLKEFMKMIGVGKWLQWLTWFITILILMIVPIVLITMLITSPLTDNGGVLRSTDTGVFFLVMLLWGMTSICFCFMISSFFSHATGGSAAGAVLWILTYVPYFFISPNYSSMSHSQKLSSCLLSNCAIAMAMRQMVLWEGKGPGAQWSNISETVSSDETLTLANVLFMLAWDIIIYAIITWYMESIRPGEHGVPRKLLFFLRPSYWCDSCHKQSSNKEKQQVEMKSFKTNSDLMERDPTDRTPGIQISKLNKVYRKQGRKFKAVDNLELNMFEGQITALLGHNGAGKTTTMKMLTGFIAPSSGTAKVGGFDIRTHLDKSRNSLGLCPQHDILFDALTVEQHLKFYCQIKGFCHTVTLSQTKNEVHRYLVHILACVALHVRMLEPSFSDELVTVVGG